MNDCYTLKISTNTLERKKDMNGARVDHGLQKMAQKIFVFGGFDNNKDFMKNAEVYDVVKNSWKNLPDMP